MLIIVAVLLLASVVPNLANDPCSECVNYVDMALVHLAGMTHVEWKDVSDFMCDHTLANNDEIDAAQCTDYVLNHLSQVFNSFAWSDSLDFHHKICTAFDQCNYENNACYDMVQKPNFGLTSAFCFYASLDGEEICEAFVTTVASFAKHHLNSTDPNVMCDQINQVYHHAINEAADKMEGPDGRPDGDDGYNGDDGYYKDNGYNGDDGYYVDDGYNGDDGTQHHEHFHYHVHEILENFRK